MKSLFYIALLFVSFNTIAQNPEQRMGKPDFTPEQQAVLQSKRLALALDLNQNQMKQVESLLLKKAAMRKQNQDLKEKKIASGVRPTQDEMFEFKTKQLDVKLEFQRQMKEILNNEQYEEWRKIKKEQFLRKQNATGKMPHHPSKHPKGFN